MSIELVKTYVYFRTHRMNLFIKASYYLTPLWQKVAEYLDCNIDTIYQMSFEDIFHALDGNMVSSEELSKRKRARNMVGENGILTITSVQQSTTDDLKDEKYSDVSVISGRIAHVGVVRGRVVVVRNMADVLKVKKGDILVASMTIPEYVPAMEKAVAFITDEGGILCHAAIVAREMKKPCVIGTGIATKVLKDGDIVEVDANKGIIEIIDN